MAEPWFRFRASTLPLPVASPRTSDKGSAPHCTGRSDEASALHRHSTADAASRGSPSAPRVSRTEWPSSTSLSPSMSPSASLDHGPVDLLQRWSNRGQALVGCAEKERRVHALPTLTGRQWRSGSTLTGSCSGFPGLRWGAHGLVRVARSARRPRVVSSSRTSHGVGCVRRRSRGTTRLWLPSRPRTR